MNSIIKSNIVSKTPWKEFLKAIEKFTEIKTTKKNIYDIFNEAMAVFSELPNTIESALFTFADNEFDFELKISNPANSNNKIYELYEYLVESGNIGIALDSASIINVDLNNFRTDNSSVLVIPLRINRGINGLVLVVHKNFTEDLNQFLLRLTALFANLLGSTIENYQILQEFEESKSTLEQKIATRTLDLAQSRREIKAIFDSVLTGIVVVDLSINKIVRVNPAACLLIGLDESNIIGRQITNFFPFTDYTKFNDNDNSQKLVYYDSELIIKDGDKIEILRNTTKLKLNNRILVTESFVDVSKIKEAEKTLTEANQLLEIKVRERTEDLQIFVQKLKSEIQEREKAEIELRKMYEQQKELSELKTRFVSMVSHEFRTPLTIIKSSAQMISKFEKNISAIDKLYYLERIIKSVDNLTDLIENVVFIGQTDAKKLSLLKRDFNLNALINNLVLDFKNGVNYERNFIINLDESLAKVNSDEKLVHIILSNLLSNAAKYSSIEYDIVISGEKTENNLILSVQDYGIGIPEEEQNKIFDLFFRAGNVNTISGTGLGLTVVKESVSKLGGWIEMKSKLNCGTLFKVFIPLSKAEG